ncbi:MAG: hypothetical protein K0S44_686 [Bacteroidetes bacterium]|jgi:hypothetical protein|nr:hypothetical protein [Bacteroidota bacterium]
MEKDDDLELLYKEYGRFKEIPQKYETAILKALSCFPELKDTKIQFRLKHKGSVPYNTKPSLSSFFGQSYEREYLIDLLEDAEQPTFYALFKNLTQESQIGVIAHELSHVVQYESLTKGELIKFIAFYLIPEFKQKIEQAADMGAIIHNCGKELLEHAIFIRSIPGYIEERPEINENYLSPIEIVDYLPEEKENYKTLQGLESEY